MRVLISSAGRRVELVDAMKAAVADFDRDGLVHAVDASPLAPALYAADNWELVPRIDAVDFIETLLSICQKNAIDVLIPTIDTELALLSRAKHAFNDIGTTVIVSEPETIDICSDKRVTHEWLSKLEFPAPKQWEPEAVDEIQKLKIPLILKPALGSRSVGVSRHANGQVNLPIDPNDVIQELIDGSEFTVSAYVDRTGKCRVAVPRRRLEVRDGEVSKGITVRDARIETLVTEVAEALPGAFGPINIQVIQETITNRLFIIEINPRFGGGDPLAWRAGADIPAWILAEQLNRDIAFENWIEGLLMLRFDQSKFILDGEYLEFME